MSDFASLFCGVPHGSVLGTMQFCLYFLPLVAILNIQSTMMTHNSIFHLNVRIHWIQNPFLTAQSTQIKSVISVPIKDFIHHYPRALFNDIPRVGAHFYDIPGSGRTFTTYPGRGAV